MGRVALIAGATGLVGGHVLERLLADPRWSRVVVLARRSAGRTHEKLTERIVDFEALASGDEKLEGPIDDVFCCLGTTARAAGSDAQRRRVDHDYTVAVARLARGAGARRLALVSSVGADERSGSFYLRVKGETERDLRAIGFESLVIVRPSLLLGDRTEHRGGERLAGTLMSAFAPLMVGPLREYRAIEAGDVAIAIVEALAAHANGELVLVHDEIVARARAATGGA
jgi:uncharacterized protein YbjT (DUF2867 family)